MDFVSDLNLIEEALERSKSIVKESTDLTRKNAERKKEVEKKLQTCFSGNSTNKLSENSFSLDLENNQLSIITKEKTQESYLYNEERIKSLNSKVTRLENEKKNIQKKMDELQDILKDQEEENLALKVKIRSLVMQIKQEEEELNKYSEEFLQLREENHRITKENKDILVKYEKVVKENLDLKERFMADKDEERSEGDGGFAYNKGKSSFSKYKHISADDRISDVRLETESSTENYYQFFKNLKKNIEVQRVPELPVPLAQVIDEKQNKKVVKSTKKSKNEDIVDKLEENYKKTDEKFKKISSNLLNNTNGRKKLSISYDTLKNFHTELSKPKISVKIKHKRTQVKPKKPKKNS